MKRIIKRLIIIAIVLIFLLGFAFVGVYYYMENYTMKAVIIKVDEKFLAVKGIENVTGLIVISNDHTAEFKQGQEILIHFNGDVMTSMPASLGNVRKVEILEENSDVAISDDEWRFFYSSIDNVSVNVNEITNSGISITIVDKNELPYEYIANYAVNNKIKNKQYTGVGEKVGEDTENSIAGFTRNRFRVYMGRSEKNFKYRERRYCRTINI